MAHQATTQELRVATWNTNRRSPSILDALDDSRDRLDIVTLQEVTLDLDDAFRDRLAAMGLNHVIYTGEPNARKKRYGNIIASRWPAESINWKRLKQKIPWPQLIAHANIELGRRQIHVITAHVPNGSRNGWEKIDTFRALAEIVHEVRGRPCILTGDFNEPQYALQDDRIVTFGQHQGRDGRYVYRRQRSFKGRFG
jgi:endonuclease/exonuclease/phosphatase family metal-dependent hydrolase